ncbi:NgoMIV restriction enzyme [Burkholderia sp. YR290]|nr:NgoMIV restriction enzyme [Burkholderia sp. YR290]
MKTLEELRSIFLERMCSGHYVPQRTGAKSEKPDLSQSIRPFYFLKTVEGYHQPSNADGQEKIAKRLADLLGVRHWDSLKSDPATAPLLVNGKGEIASKPFPGQTCGHELEKLTSWFLQEAFVNELRFLRPGKFRIKQGGFLKSYQQYRHLEDFERVLDFIPNHETALKLRLSAAFSSYAVKPDLVITRSAVTRHEINESWQQQYPGEEKKSFISEGMVLHSPLLEDSSEKQHLLHAIISAKWSIRSDRAQNARTEGAFASQQRRGNAPRFVVVTGEPKPSRIRSLTEGADVDCVYHICLEKLQQAVEEVGAQEKDESLETVASGAVRPTEKDRLKALLEMNRLRDITDLPFDLSI